MSLEVKHKITTTKIIPHVLLKSSPVLKQKLQNEERNREDMLKRY